eukprot:COSAG05_NODE_14884_length_384_cov_0.905263_1_plen_35_part_01
MTLATAAAAEWLVPTVDSSSLLLLELGHGFLLLPE